MLNILYYRYKQVKTVHKQPSNGDVANVVDETNNKQSHSRLPKLLERHNSRGAQPSENSKILQEFVDNGFASDSVQKYRYFSIKPITAQNWNPHYKLRNKASEKNFNVTRWERTSRTESVCFKLETSGSDLFVCH